jgi:hypothetical protein
VVTANIVAVNVAVVAPTATVTLAGTVSLALPLDSVTVNGAPEAASLSVTVHVEEPGAFTLAGEQERLLTTVAAFRFTVVVWVCAPSVAVTVAVESTLTVPAVAVKVPLLAPVIFTLAGTGNVPLLLERFTVTVPDFDSVTVQVVVCPDPSVLGVQLTADSCTGATRFTVNVCEAPPPEAVTTAV